MAEDLSGATLGGGSKSRRRKRRSGGAATREKWSLAEGETLGGYRVVKPLGRGGMGEVYLAENVQTGVRYALKLLPSDLASDSGFRERFRREAAVLQTLRHDGIVMVHHAAEEGGRFFLTMDYVDGGSLDDRLKAEGKLGEVETARIALELCDALAYAHGKGIVHRDIKPANVLLDRDGRAKLSDFGLARVVGDEFLKSMTQRSISLSMAKTDAGLSQSDDAVVGTYEYMSPEQQAGAPADERSDIYSLALVIYRMLTGEQAKGRFPDPSEFDCTDGWDGIIDRALAPKPERRYASFADLTADVRKVGEAVTSAWAPRRAEEERRRREREEGERERMAVAERQRQQKQGERRRATEERERRERERGHAAGVELRAPASGGSTAARPAEASGRSVSPQARVPRGVVALFVVLGISVLGALTLAISKLAGRSRETPRREATELSPATPYSSAGGQEVTAARAGLVAAYSFVDGARDQSGNGHDGTVDGATPTAAGMLFDGLRSRVVIPASATFELRDAITIAACISRARSGGNAPILGKCGNQPNGSSHFEFFVGPDNRLTFHFYAGTWVRHTSRGSLPDSDWHWVAVTYDRNEVRFYIDGRQDSAFGQTRPMPANGSTLQIGEKQSSGPFEYFKGTMRYLYVYNRALSEAEVRTLPGTQGSVFR